jgi:hypothetical protein
VVSTDVSGQIRLQGAKLRLQDCLMPVRYQINPDGQKGWQFLSRAKEVIESAGFSLRHEVFAESYDN